MNRLENPVDLVRVLVVDDWQTRHDKIKKEMYKARFQLSWRNRMNPDEVTEDDLKWATLIFLDHDMCQRGITEAGLLVFDESRPCPNPIEQGRNALDPKCGCPTGMDLVRRICALPYRPAAVVHTGNTVEAPNMTRTLQDAGFRVMAMSASRWNTVNWKSSIELLLSMKR